MMSLTPSAQKTLVERYSSIEPTMAELKQAILILAARHDDHDRRLKSLEESCADSHRGTAAAVRSIVEMREREQALLARLDHNDQAIAAVLAEHARKVDMPGLEALLALKADKKSADQRLRDAARQLAELREQVFALTDGKGVDVIIDPIGGDFFDAAIRALAWRGRLVVIGFAAGRIPQIKVNYLLVKNIEVSGLQVSDYRKRRPEQVAECYRDVFSLFEAGRLTIHEPTELPLSQFSEGLRLVDERAATGRILLIPPLANAEATPS
jgi:hypothetical protein